MLLLGTAAAPGRTSASLARASAHTPPLHVLLAPRRYSRSVTASAQSNGDGSNSSRSGSRGHGRHLPPLDDIDDLRWRSIMAIEAEADAKQRETASPVPPLASVPAMLQAALAAWLGGIVTRLDSAVRALAAPSSTDAADAPDSEDDEGAAAASPAIDAATQQAARQVLEDAWRKS